MNVPGRSLVLTTLLVACILAACSSATARSRGGSGGSAILTQEQITKTNSDNLYDAITKLRPEWLTSRGPTSVTDMTPTAVHVYMNGNFLGDAEYLRQVRSLDVSEVRYWDAGEASARFGMGHPRGVIELTRK
jgi:hypothetical protein